MPTISYDFTGRSVIVTGAARGIGLELSRFFSSHGAKLAMVDLDERELKAAASTLGALPLSADVGKTSDVEDVTSTVVREFGGVDVLVNNAGILRDGVVWKLSDDDWNAVLDVHAGGTFRFTRACVPHFRARGRGRIINVTSYTGLRGNTGQANYAAAKAGIIGFTKTTAKELARFGVTVNAISPNAHTRMVDSIPDEKLAELSSAIPLGRFAEPAEICPAVGFLASDEASYITGVVLPVDGGISI
ncbi:SDR family NAD(P)-dependent oxidoreductase [Streptomyces griseorubiginosus]|uniref:SDR family NAD(P)-dependent oxidoreductase n=1 Tax=Streptomyces griseorubiginosus TaxID=67304 RepID=UPI001AD6FF4D|nr:SDR family oxidoreductase [Streptomyces griseorubiginosus]MBO4252331.1 SDR family oxidoreductase [Streptomyces griseorubiginosus]